MEIEQTSDSSSKIQQPAKKVTSSKKINVLKKLDPDTAKQLLSLKEKINKKPYGRKVKDSEILAAAIRLLDAESIAQLQEATLSEKDRLSIAHDEYQKQFGKISLDQFIGKLLKGDLAQKAK